MSKIIRGILSLIFIPLLAGIFTITNTQTAAADGNFLHDLVIEHSTASQYRGSLTICKDWGTTSCGSRSPHGWLAKGRNSKTQYGWRDTDGFYKPAGYWAKIKYFDGYYTGCSGSAGKWCKLSGPGKKYVILIKY